MELIFTEKQIREYITLGKGENGQLEFPETFSLKHKFAEAKILIDRWNLVTTDFVIHSSLKEFIRDNLGDALTRGLDKKPKLTLKDLYDILGKLIKDNPEIDMDIDIDSLNVIPKATNDVNCDYMWGAIIHYSDSIPKDKGIALALSIDDASFQDEEYPERCVAVFPM